MQFKPWCAAPSHPLVLKIEEKYGLSNKDARTILNDARQNDPEIQGDNITFEFLEQNESFKNSLAKYVQGILKEDDPLRQMVPNFTKDVVNKRKEFEQELNQRDLSDEDIAWMMERRDELGSIVRHSQLSSKELADIISSFKDLRRLEFIGSWICQYISESITLIDSDQEYRDAYRVEKKNDRKEYWTDTNTMQGIRSVICDELNERADELEEEGNETLAEELRAAVKHYNALLYMYGANIFRIEGVSIKMNGNAEVEKIDDDSAEMNEGDEEEGEDDDDKQEAPVAGFSASDQNKSVMSKFVPSIKALLSNIREKDSKGEVVTDNFGYGLHTYIRVPKAVNKLLTLLKGTQSYSEMIQRLERNRTATPWIGDLLTALDTSLRSDITGDSEMTSSKKEQLQTMFFQSFRKQFTHLRNTYQAHDTEGNEIVVNANANVSEKSDELMRKVVKKYRKMSGLRIFNNGMIDFDAIKAIDDSFKTKGRVKGKIRAQLDAARTEAFNLARNGITKSSEYKDAFRLLSDAEDSVKEALVSLGIGEKRKIKTKDGRETLAFWGLETMMEETLSNTNGDYKGSMYGGYQGDPKFEIRYNRLNELVSKLSNLTKAFMDWKAAMDSGLSSDTPLTNPIIRKKGSSDYKKIYYIRNWYENVINHLTEFSEDAIESRARINGKDYYSWNNPSSIGTIIESLSFNDKEKVQDYIKKKYMKDAMWFMKEGSTSDNPQFYSEWLNELYNGTGRNVIAYSEKPSFLGVDYEKQTDTSYALSILNDYFTVVGMDEGTAWYRTHIASDKPRYATIKFYRYTRDLDASGNRTENDYHNVITRQAEQFFAQELRRAIEVAAFSKVSGETKIDGYDLSAKDKIEERKEKKTKTLEKLKKGEKITSGDLLYDGRYIFRNSGASFYLNKFLNDAIEATDDSEGALRRFREKYFGYLDEIELSENEDKINRSFENFKRLGNYIIDRVFNPTKESRQLIEDSILAPFRSSFEVYMNSIKENYFEKLDSIGMLADRLVKSNDPEKPSKTHLKYLYGNMLQWNRNSEDYTTRIDAQDKEARRLAENQGYDWEKIGKDASYFKEIAQFREDLDEFVYNNWMAKANMSEILDVDLAFYGSTPNFQKRNAQILSAGFVTDTEALLHGKPVSDGKYRSITIQTKKEVSKHLKHIETVLKRTIREISDPLQRRQFEAQMNDTLEKLKNFDPTDGQAFTSLTGLRKRLVGRGEWTRSDSSELDDRDDVFTDEAVYRRIKKGKATIQDYLHVFAQPQKPFVYTFANMNRKGRGTITVPTQHKNSEYALIFLTAMTSTDKPKSQLEAIYKFLEQSAEADPLTGIDTVNFDSGVKIGGNSGVIDLHDLDGQKTLEALQKAVYGSKTAKKVKENYKAGVVTEYDAADYKIQQVKPEHFKDSAQQMGSQMKILAINNIKDNQEVTLPDGTVITGKEMKRRYFDLLRKKMRNATRDFEFDMGLRLPHDKRLHKLSTTLKNALASDQKFTAETRRALSITTRDGVEQFVVPLDEPSMQSAVESMLYSKIRKVYYKEKVNGGIVVQATSWGASEDLNIRFYSDAEEDKKRGGILATYEEFLQDNRLKDWAVSRKKYDKYVEEHQQGYAYFEAEIPMQDHIKDMLRGADGQVEAKYFNPDGTWNMEEIRKTVPDSCFDAICYRLPTEAKYSMMVCRIVRFSPEGPGSAAKYPKELTEFTGSDFDIDTDTVELRPKPDSKNRDKNIDNEMFDLQLAALRSKPAALETFMSGDFSDLSDFSYYVALLEKGFTPEQLNAMSPGVWKVLCEQEEDLDLMDPTTDIILHRQNSDSKQMIAIAAVGVTSHAFYSLYNDIDENDPQRDPSANPQNFLRIYIPESHGKSENHSFRVINDSAGGENKTEKYIGGYAFLDMMHDMDGRLVSTLLSRYVGASADAAKDPAEFRLNLTTDTLPIAQAMHRLGISNDVIKVFIAQPVIRQIVAKLNSANDSGYNKIKNACNEVLEEILEGVADKNERESLWANVTHDDSLQLVYSELQENIHNKNGQSAYDKAKILHIFMTLNDISHKLGTLDSFPRYNSAKAMRGTSFLDRYALRQKIIRLGDMLGTQEDIDEGRHPTIVLPQDVQIMDPFPGTEIGRLCSMFPYVGMTILGEDELTDKVILENMRTYHPAFFEVVRKLHLEEDAATMKALYAGWKNYLLFVGDHRIADFSNEDVARFYTRDFAEYYDQTLEDIRTAHPEVYSKVIENNEFINRIGYVHAKQGYGDFDVLTANMIGMTDTVLEQYKSDWEALINHPETRQLGINLAIHFLARSAAFSRDTPVHVMPLAVKETIPGYIQAFADAGKVAITDEQLDNFMELFARNNSDNKKVVPHFYNKEKRVVAGYKDGVLRFIKKNATTLSNWLEKTKDGGIRIISPVISVDDQLYLVLDDSVVPEVDDDKKDEPEVLTYTIEAAPVTPLGIPNQLAEYRYSDEPIATSLYYDTNEEPGEEEEEEEGGMDPERLEDDDYIIEPDEVFYQGRRSGTYFDSSPYDYGYNESPDVDVALATDTMDTDNSYLESRTHLRRLGKITSAFGLKIESTSKGLAFNGTPRYEFNVSAPGMVVDQHQQAVSMAAFAYALGYSHGYEPTVKTYVSNPRDGFDTVELTLAMEKDPDRTLINKINDYLAGQIVVDYDSSAKAFRFSVDNNMFDARTKRMIKSVVAELNNRGLTNSDRLEINFARTDILDEERVHDILERFRNGEEQEEQLVQRGAARALPVDSGRTSERSDVRNGQQISLSDLADLALRRIEGEKVGEEIRQLFGERKYPLANIVESHTSRVLTDTVAENIKGGELADTIANVFSGDVRNTDVLVSNLIINTANWILGNRSRDTLGELYQKTGFDSETAKGIISEIDRVLKELDIC